MRTIWGLHALEWAGVALIVLPPYVIGWWSFALVPLIMALLFAGSKRRLATRRSDAVPHG